MTELEDIPEPDRAEGVPHPRMALRVFGQGTAEAAFLDAFTSGRFHHAWLITGPRGVGKATLAWRLARFLLTRPADTGGGLFGDAPADPDTLDTPEDHPVTRHIHALSEPRLALVRRGWDFKLKRLKTQLTVDEVRDLNKFFGLSASDGGRRVVIVDAADEMNPSAANALLKLLEEPPALATFLLVAHQPARLLPTIRSRCRELRCATLGPADLTAALEQAGIDPPADPDTLAELAGGAPGAAVDLVALDGAGFYADLLSLFADAPRIDQSRAAAMTASLRPNDAKTFMAVRLIETFLARLSATGAGRPPARPAVPSEPQILARLAPDLAAAQAWAGLAQRLGDRARHGLGVNLDPPALILDMVLTMNETASALMARA